MIELKVSFGFRIESRKWIKILEVSMTRRIQWKLQIVWNNILIILYEYERKIDTKGDKNSLCVVRQKYEGLIMLLHQEFVNVILCFLWNVLYSLLVNYYKVHETNPKISLPSAILNLHSTAQKRPWVICTWKIFDVTYDGLRNKIKLNDSYRT